MAKEEPAYRIDRLAEVDRQIRSLAVKAEALGFHRQYVQALRFAIEMLRSRPLQWGDPERRTRKAGGWVCHGIRRPLVVHYVVFEPERVVCILTESRICKDIIMPPRVCRRVG